MNEQHLPPLELVLLAAYLGAPVLLIGGICQLLLLLRRHRIPWPRALLRTVVTQLGGIPVALVFWTRWPRQLGDIMVGPVLLPALPWAAFLLLWYGLWPARRPAAQDESGGGEDETAPRV